MTFDKILDDGRLWAVRYEGHEENCFEELFGQWYDMLPRMPILICFSGIWRTIVIQRCHWERKKQRGIVCDIILRG